MSIFTRIFGDALDRACTGSSTIYLTARASTAAGNSTALTVAIGQSFATPNYAVNQGALVFDTSTIPAGASIYLSLWVSVAGTTTTDPLEIRQSATANNKIAGASLAGLTLLGSFTTPTATGRFSTLLTGDPTRDLTSDFRIHSQNERLGTAPTVNDQFTAYLADQTGTTNDPYLDVLTGTSWVYVGRGTSVEATATSHVLTEPAGAASGDLLVACIGSRIASTTSITLPSGWALVAEAKNNNILSTSSALPSGMMAYILRGGSAPSYTFTHPTAPSVALGRVFAYRNVHQTTPTDTGTTAVTTGTALLAVSVTGLTTTVDDDLIVALTAGGQEAAWSAFAATDPATGSGTTADSALDPQFGAWLERSDIQTTTGVDTSLAVFDAIKQTAGATGNLIATASVSAGHVVVAGSFKLAASGNTYNDAITEATTAAAETVSAEYTLAGPVAEAGAAAETVASLLDATRVVAETAAAADTLGGMLVTEKAIAETAAAAETLTGGLAFAVTVAETAAAAETITHTLAFTGAVAETASAADTVGGLMVVIGAIAETASAIEATDASLVAAPGVFNEIVAESAAAADTLGGLLVSVGAIAEAAAAADTLTKTLNFTDAIAEVASAAETITKTLTFTGAVAETAAAADTVGGLTLRIGAIAESASAAETTAGLLTFTAAVAEVASAAETIVPIVVPAGGTLYEDTVLETLAAFDTVGAANMASAGVILEVLAASDTVVADLIPGTITPEVPVLGGPGPAGEGVRRRFELYLLPEEDEDEPKPRRKRRLRLKKAELEDRIEETVEYIEAGSPRPMSQQAMVAEVSTLMGLDALLEIDRRRVERTIYRYLQTLIEEEEEEGMAMMLLAA
jgi:hypothetical protein